MLHSITSSGVSCYLQYGKPLVWGTNRVSHPTLRSVVVCGYGNPLVWGGNRVSHPALRTVVVCGYWNPLVWDTNRVSHPALGSVVVSGYGKPLVWGTNRVELWCQLLFAGMGNLWSWSPIGLSCDVSCCLQV